MHAEPSIRVLIVDDEYLSRRRLEKLVLVLDGVEIVGIAENGNEGVEMIRHLNPDIVLLDVQMPGKTGLEVIQEIGPEHMPVVIFVTAYDQHALKAFELAALDYLLKPFDDDRFYNAFARARHTAALRELDRMRSRLNILFDPAPAQATPGSAPGRYMERIAVETRGRVRVVPVRTIDFIRADGPYAELYVEDEKYVIRENMHTLEERLDPALFVRIHRSTIVQIDRIDTLISETGTNYAIRLIDGRHLKVSRTRWEDLKQRLGIYTPGK